MVGGFGADARERPRRLNITIQEVAAKIGRAPSYVCSHERGHILGSSEDRARMEAFLSEREQPLPIPQATPRRSEGRAARQ